jgi:hypothetical protein
MLIVSAELISVATDVTDKRCSRTYLHSRNTQGDEPMSKSLITALVLALRVATLNFIAKMVAPLPGYVSNHVSRAPS